jgi:predicted component of type VI protein secretion system
MEIKLIVAGGKQTGKEIPIAGRKFLIGRSEECQLRPQHTEVSRKHCVILVEEGAASIEDCGSTNGTFVNDQRITGRHVLSDGDRIRVGMLALVVRLTAVAASEKKAKVQTVQEAAVRTVASPMVSGDDLDISSWLGDESTLELAPTRKQPVTAGDTMAGKSLDDTGSIPVPHIENKKEKKEEAKQKEPPAKTPGKPHAVPRKPAPGDSGAAADDALRQLFHRRKA